MKTVKVRNMVSHKTGYTSIANQFIIETVDGTYFQSYQSIIAFIPNDGGKVQLDETYWNYSRTTSKYRNDFLGCNTKQARERIKSGDYVLTNLNG